MSRLKGKSKDILPKSSTPGSSRSPVYSRTTSSPPPTSPPPSKTTHYDTTRARALQARLDSERASLELARQLQAQEEATIQEHRRMMQEAARVKTFDCAICMEQYPEDYSAPIRSCGHVLCRTCMREHVQSQVRESIWPIRCPMCVADHSRTGEQGSEFRPVP